MMKPKKLIAYYTAKLENPDLKPGSRKVASATSHHLTSMQAEIEIKESTIANYHKKNMMLYTENKIQHEALEALRAENTKLYADLCEMGDMARERSRMRRGAVIGIDLAGGVDYTVDTLIRHKWPEEKPEKDGQYLIRIISPIGSVYYRLRGYEDGEWHNFGNYLTHWWNLPEVTE